MKENLIISIFGRHRIMAFANRSFSIGTFSLWIFFMAAPTPENKKSLTFLQLGRKSNPRPSDSDQTSCCCCCPWMHQLEISRRKFFSPKKPVVVSGDLTFSMRWLQLTSASNATNVTDAPVVVVTIFVYSCNNLVGLCSCLVTKFCPILPR